MKRKNVPKVFPRESHLFLSALLTDEVGCAEAHQDNDAAAHGSVLVVFQAVDRQQGLGSGLP